MFYTHDDQEREMGMGVDELHSKIPDRDREIEEGILAAKKGQTNPQPRSKTNKYSLGIAGRSNTMSQSAKRRIVTRNESVCKGVK